MTDFRRLSFVLALTLLVAVPHTASADLRLTPFGGVSIFDNDNKGTFGAAIGFGGLFGFEFDVARIQLGSYEDVLFVDFEAHATTFMGNVVVRLPAGPVQPYGSAGVGVVRVTGDVNVPFLGDLVSVDAQDFGWNIGGGVSVFPSPRIGIRGDVRHFRTTDVTFEDVTSIGGIDDLPLPSFDFWRITGGVTIRF
jgi:opacity protein-like surface antigen